MQIYDKPVRELLKQFVNTEKIKRGEKISRSQVVNWFKTKYPKIKKATVTAHLIKMSINAPSRIHYSVKSDGSDDLFYQINPKYYRLYEPNNDPIPIVKIDIDNETDFEADNSDADNNIGSSEFAYEKDLRNFLSKNLNIIEAKLTLYEDDEGITGIEFPVGGRFIDILAKDKNNNFVVIELKVSKGYDRVVGQILRYMAWIEKNLAEKNQKVRGIIVASNITEDLKLATSKVKDILLLEYELAIKVKKIV